MKTRKLIAILTLILTSLMLISCSDDNNQSSSTQGTQGSKSSNSEAPAIAVKESKLIGFLNKENSCDLILPVDKIKQALNIQTEIRVNGSEYRGDTYCDYNWDKADKAERSKKYQFYLSERMSKKIEEVPMRLRAITSSFRMVVSKTNAQADRFVPLPKSEEEIQILVDRAKKSASDALTDEQKALAGDSANDMVESLIRKSNQTTEIKNLGDAAYWSNLIGGMMYVLDGNAHVELSTIQIGNTMEEDMKNATIIAKLIVE